MSTSVLMEENSNSKEKVQSPPRTDVQDPEAS